MNAITNIKRIENGYQLGKLAAMGLPPRESQALLLAANGLSQNESATLMNCSAANIKGRLTNLFYKVSANSKAELITKCFENGILRFLSICLAIHIGIAAPGDYQFTRTRVRVARTPVKQEMRAA
jgi:DNA-binding CsgD family transcriptional regulator